MIFQSGKVQVIRLHNYIALIPAYKPTAILPELIGNLKEYGFSVVLVDDGSGADYEKIFSLTKELEELKQREENVLTKWEECSEQLSLLE